MIYTDPASRAAAQRALYSLRVLLASLTEIRTHAHVYGDQDRLKWADDSLSQIKADIARLESDLGPPGPA